MFQLLRHVVTETQPLCLHPNTPNSAPWHCKNTGFKPGSWLEEQELTPLFHMLRNSGIRGENSICNIYIARN